MKHSGTLLKKVISKMLTSKIASLQCSWIKRLYDDKFHEWKLIPLYLIKSTFGINFKLHSSMDFDDSKISIFPTIYKQLFRNWCKYLCFSITIPFSSLSQPIQYNKNIKRNSKPIYVKEFAKQNIIFLYAKVVAWRCSLKKGVLRNFTKFTRKHLCQSRFFNKVAGLVPESLFSGGVEM